MAEFANLLAMFAIGFGIGSLYGRMKGQRAEDELRIQIADLTQANRILKKRLDAE